MPNVVVLRQTIRVYVIRPDNGSSHTASSTDVVVPATRRSSLGDRAFPVAGARAWNALPPSVTSAPSLSLYLSLSIPFLFQRQLSV